MLRRVAVAMRRSTLQASARAGAARRSHIARGSAAAGHDHSRGIHSCGVCRADTKAPDFGSTAAVTVTAEVEFMTPSARPGLSSSMLVRRRVAAEQDGAVPFGAGEPALPDRLLAHVRRVDLNVQPKPLDDEQMSDLKAKIIAINQRIRRELQMQPATFYQRFMDPQDLSTNVAMDETTKRQRLFRPPSVDFHPTLSESNEETALTGYLSAHGLDNDPNQHIFDLLGHALPKPLPPKQPCLFCRPSRDHPPEYYAIDYTNVNLLHRFLNARGMISQRKYNHNCAKHQRKVANAIKRARFIGLLSFTSRYHVPRSFIAPVEGDFGTGAGAAAAAAKVEANELMKTPEWSARQTASALATGQLKGADFKFWTQEGADELDTARRKPRAPIIAAPGARVKRDPNSLA